MIELLQLDHEFLEKGNLKDVSLIYRQRSYLSCLNTMICS